MNLLERRTQLEMLHTTLHDAVSQRGKVVLVSGETGIGKTALVTQFATQAADTTSIWWGACDALETPRPLAPFHDIAQKVPELLALFERNTDLHSIASAFLSLLEQTAPAPLVILEDVHWADQATLDLIKYLGRRIGSTRALLIITFRDDELGLAHPLRILLGDLASTTTPIRIPIFPLSEDAVRTLVGSRIIDPGALYQQTDGNPFYVTEVLASPTESVPISVRDAVLARAARLPPGARILLDTASVIGARVEPWLLADLASAEIDAAEECIANGMLQIQGEAIGFRHELARRAILDSLSPPRRVTLHRAVLAALRASPRTNQDVARLAYHAQAAGDAAAVLEYAPVAASQAAGMGAHRQAAEQYARALEFAGSLSEPELATLWEAYAYEASIIDSNQEAIRAQRNATKLWGDLGNKPRLGKAENFLALLYFRSGENSAAEQASMRAIATARELPPPSLELAESYRIQGALRMLNRDLVQAIEWETRTIEAAQSLDAPETIAGALNVMGTAQLLMGDPEGRPTVEKSIALYRSIGNANAAAIAIGNLASGSGEIFDLQVAREYLALGLQYSAENELDQPYAYALAWQALVDLYQGEWNRAADAAQSVLNRPGASAISRIMALVALARLRTRRGDPGAIPVLDEALALANQTQTLQRLAPVHAAYAEYHWLNREPEQVLAHARAVYPLAIEKKHPWFAGELAYWQALVSSLDRVPEWVARPYSLEFAGDHSAAAREWQARTCPYEAARALAVSLDPEDMKQALNTFEQLGALPAADHVRRKMRSANLKGIPRGPRSATRENLYGLTPREMQILPLVVDGLNNSEIASRLVISPRTVEHHLSSILSKLNVGSRAEAISFALRNNLLKSRQ